jgi:DNA-binding FadR family transcriptional regulator
MENKKQVPEAAESGSGEPIGFKPLYAQVRERLMRRLVEGAWLPGMLLPSEMELARQLNVSQGTVRKALDSMTADNLCCVVRAAAPMSQSQRKAGSCSSSSGFRRTTAQQTFQIRKCSAPAHASPTK